jgi:hypothetical protein
MDTDDVIWQPLAFGNRSRARIIVADDNVVGSVLLSSAATMLSACTGHASVHHRPSS